MNGRILLTIGCVISACVRPTPVPPPPVAAAAQARTILLERPRCYGNCPAYNVAMSTDGSVRFEGVANVAVLAVREWRVPADSAAKAFRFADSIRFDDFPPRYEFGVAGCTPYMADHPAFAISLGSGSGTQSRRVYADEGCANVPASLKALRDVIDRVSGVEARSYARP